MLEYFDNVKFQWLFFFNWFKKKGQQIMKYIRNLELNERTKSIKTEENKIEKKMSIFIIKLSLRRLKKKLKYERS